MLNAPALHGGCEPFLPTNAPHLKCLKPVRHVCESIASPVQSSIASRLRLADCVPFHAHSWGRLLDLQATWIPLPRRPIGVTAAIMAAGGLFHGQGRPRWWRTAYGG